MYDPLLDVGLPDDLVLPGSTSRLGAASSEKIVLLQQVYVNEKAQENLRAVCRTFSEEAGVRLITVEGAEGQVVPRQDARSVAVLLQQRCRLSAGIEVLLNIDGIDIEVWGVDDLDAESSSLAAMERVTAAAALRDDFFGKLRTHLGAAQDRSYPPAVVKLRRSQLALYGQWQTTKTGGEGNYAPNLSRSTSDVIADTKRAAAQVDLDLRSFPLIPLYDTLLMREKQIRQDRVTAQQAEFVKRLGIEIVSGMNGNAGINLEKAEPIVQFWMKETKISVPEFQGNVKMRGLDAVLAECYHWIISWITERARAAQTGRDQGAIVMEDMMRLALRLEVPYFDLREFRDWVAYGRQARELTAAGLMDQISECCRLIVGKVSNRTAFRLLETEERLDLLFLGLRLELMPTESETAEFSPETTAGLVAEVCRIADLPRSVAAGLDALSIAEAVRSAQEFYEKSRKRGRLMAERTLEVMRKRGEDRALLVAGGFHERAITRNLEDHREVSWSVITPRPQL